MTTALDHIRNAESVGEVIGLAVGAGSTCWENMSETGLFQDQAAAEIVTAARHRINELNDRGVKTPLPEAEPASMQDMVKAFHEGGGQPVGLVPHPLPQSRVPVRVELIREEFEDELIPALEAGDMVETVDACIDILYVTFGLLVEMGVDAMPVFAEVQRSNMSKFDPETGKAIIAGPNDPDGIFEGRVKKGPLYFKPDLRSILLSGVADLQPATDYDDHQDH